MRAHIAAARLDFYHRAANELLTEYDTVAVGKCGVEATRRAKAKCAARRTAKITITRSACLSSSCGAVHENRDFASAGAIARRAAEKLASGAQPRSSQPARKGWQTQRRRSLAGRTKVARAASVKIPVNDEAETVRSAYPKTPSAASAAVPDHDERSARAPLSPVAHEDSDIGVSSQDRQPGKPRGPLERVRSLGSSRRPLARRRARWVRATVRLASSGSEARGDDGFLARTLRPQVWDSGV
jgi:hypothetical protein